jgi:hypothetical protein
MILVILYHGSTQKRCENIIKVGHHESGHKRNPNDDSVLYATDSLNMAKSYGKYVIEIDIDENDERVKCYPIYPNAYDYYEKWMDCTNEYRIPMEVKFKAKFI